MNEAQQKNVNTINELNNWLDNRINTKKDTETEKTEGKYKLKNRNGQEQILLYLFTAYLLTELSIKIQNQTKHMDG